MKRKSFSLVPLTTGLLCWLIGGTIINAQESFIEVNGDTLTADVDDIPLAEVIEVLNEQQSATVQVSGTVLNRPEARVSATFDHLPLRDGINRLLKGHGHLLNFNSKSAQPGINIRLIAAAPPVERPIVSEPPPLPAGSGDELIERLQQLADAEDPQGLTGALGEASIHPDMPVRLEALRIFNTLDEEDLPLDQVQQMALTDPELSLRLQALEIIGRQANEQATEILTQLTQNVDAQVAERATALLEKIARAQ